MKKYKPLLEMAKPRKSDLAKIYYHGTSTEEAGKNIIKSGFHPSMLDIEYSLSPRDNKVYITPHLRYAIIYALGGDMLGHDSGFSGYGYLFVISGKELRDIEPDEDSIGEMLYNKSPKWLYDMALDLDSKEVFNDYVYTLTDEDDLESTLNSLEYEGFFMDMVKDGLYSAWAVAGKAMLEYLTDTQKLKLISQGSHLAHEGTIDYKEVWKFDKVLSKHLKKDGSNFFKLAQRVK